MPRLYHSVLVYHMDNLSDAKDTKHDNQITKQAKQSPRRVRSVERTQPIGQTQCYKKQKRNVWRRWRCAKMRKEGKKNRK